MDAPKRRRRETIKGSLKNQLKAKEISPIILISPLREMEKNQS
jgi:hypothetical protein